MKGVKFPRRRVFGRRLFSFAPAARHFLGMAISRKFVFASGYNARKYNGGVRPHAAFPREE
jgi:hypothetical protein